MSPVNPSQFNSVIPSASSDLCGKIKKVLLEFPSLAYQFFNWFLASDGAISDDAKAEIASYLYQPGDLKVSASVTVTTGFLLCQGQAVNRTTYAALYAAIGTTYGSGDGSTTFNIPDYRDTFLVGASGTKPLGVDGGEEDVTLTVDQIPSHTHDLKQVVAPFIVSSGFDLDVRENGSGLASGATGGGLPHNNLPPYRAVNILIKT